MVVLERGQLFIEFLGGMVDGRNTHGAQTRDELFEESWASLAALPRLTVFAA